MIVYVDAESKIRAVNTTMDESLKPLEINDETSPFKGWSNAKICCYKVSVSDGIVTMMTPYVDSRMLDMVDNIGHQIDNSTPYKCSKIAYIDDTEIVFEGMPGGAYSVSFDKPVNMTQVTKESFTDGTNTFTVEFEPLEEVTEVTLTIL